MAQANGTFDVKLEPQHPSDQAQAAMLGRMTIDKQFSGDLEAGSTGEMLAAMTGVEGSAGYVALERVTGTLHGRRGSFFLQHNGIMARGVQKLEIAVVPDSGTEELATLAGKMMILVEDGEHRYEFTYSL